MNYPYSLPLSQGDKNALTLVIDEKILSLNRKIAGLNQIINGLKDSPIHSHVCSLRTVDKQSAEILIDQLTSIIERITTNAQSR